MTIGIENVIQFPYIQAPSPKSSVLHFLIYFKYFFFSSSLLLFLFSSFIIFFFFLNSLLLINSLLIKQKEVSFHSLKHNSFHLSLFLNHATNRLLNRIKPNVRITVAATLERLYLLSAVDRSMRLTAAGRRMAEFPLDPTHAKTLIAAAELCCTDEVCAVLEWRSGGDGGDGAISKGCIDCQMRSHKGKQTNKQTFILSSEINSHFFKSICFYSCAFISTDTWKYETYWFFLGDSNNLSA